MSADQVQATNTCGCCEDEGSPTLQAIQNRPGLPSIQYRVGTYVSFLLAMSEQISRTPELRARLLTRSTDDFGMALLAMWAYVADILTFYQERIANEVYLRTARFQESVVALAALLGYKPAPGAAAEADLAFFLEQNKLGQIPAGLLVQSVPGQNEKPQKFETVEGINADAALNQLHIFPQPAVYSPFAHGSSTAVLVSDPKGLAPRVKLACFNPQRAELKEVNNVFAHNTQQFLAWTPAIQSSDFNFFTTQVAVYAREFRLFGHDAPGSFVQAVKDTSAPGGVRFDLHTAPYTGSSLSNLPTSPTNRLALDARYNDVKPGSRVLISNPSDSFARLATVTDVSSERANYGPLDATVTWLTLDDPPFSFTNRDGVTVYEVTRLLGFSPFQYGDSISGNTVYVPVSQMPRLNAKRSIILDDAAASPQTVKVQTALQVDTDGDGQPDHWRISFTPDLMRTLSTATATLYGNVCEATHGQTIAKEVLGDGDASTTFQSFRLQKSPVTFVHQPGAPHGVADTLQVQIACVIWKEADDFFGHAADERIFVTTQDAKGMSVQFGDGGTGSRLPTGRGNVVGTYRRGIGLAGNVPAGALRTLLDRPVGLKGVSNPGAASGGAEPESIDQTRGNAPNTVRTFGRIVSLQDFEDTAREFAGVSKARASWLWSGEEQIVYLTVAGAGGTPITGPAFDNLVTDLNSRRDPNRKLRVRGYSNIAVAINVTVFVSADHVRDIVLAAAQDAVAAYFSFDNQQFGRPVHLSTIYGVLQGVEGIVGTDITTLQYKHSADATSHGASSNPVQVHLRINDDELAALEDPASDALITIGHAP